MAPEPVDDDVAQARALLERRITTIERRLAELDELRAERERLIKALDLLGPFSSSTPGSGPTSQPTPPRRARPARRSGPREDNAAATLAFLRKHPDRPRLQPQREGDHAALQVKPRADREGPVVQEAGQRNLVARGPPTGVQIG